mgnify:CR=1 FL=1
MSEPDLYSYLDYRAWLKDWFAAKKAANRRFSHRAFVRMAGKSSPSLLVDVIERRRNLTPSTTEAFCRALKLAAAEASFFTALVHLDQAESPAERNEAWARIAATRRFREARKLEGESFEFLSCWYYPAIHELTKLPDFSADPAWIARSLRPNITVPQARRALSALQEMGLIRVDGDSARQCEGSITTPHEVEGLAVHNYHLGMLQRAQESIDAFEPHQRHFVGLTVAVPDSLVPTLKAELNALQERLLDLCDSAPSPADQVVQVGLHFFPLTESSVKEPQP